MLESVKSRLADEHKLELVVSDQVREELLKRCTTDLANGGRGIGNQLEAAFINPLSRALFAISDLESRQRVEVRSIAIDENTAVLELA
jgi:ATP-dependent Clp protease ATP-binding subunit ClpA